MKTNKPDFQDTKVLKRVKSVGTQSHVLKHAEITDKEVLLGHACFFDFENSNYEKAVKELTKKHDTRAIFVFESSENNYHAISARIMSLQEINSLKSCLSYDDDAHNEVGYKKGSWTLRVTEKGYKEKPKHVKTYFDVYDYEKPIVYSKPHLHIIKQLYKGTMAENIAEIILNNEKCVGSHTRLVRYSTHENNH